MFTYCCSQPQIDNVLEKDINNLRIRIEEMKKQINNIYELLEALTNESKHMIKTNYCLLPRKQIFFIKIKII